MTTTIIIVVLVSPAQMDKISQATLCFSIYLIAPDDHALPIPLMFVFFRFYDHLPTLLTRRRRRRLCVLETHSPRWWWSSSRGWDMMLMASEPLCKSMDVRMMAIKSSLREHISFNLWTLRTSSGPSYPLALLLLHSCNLLWGISSCTVPNTMPLTLISTCESVAVTTHPIVLFCRRVRCMSLVAQDDDTLPGDWMYSSGALLCICIPSMPLFVAGALRILLGKNKLLWEWMRECGGRWMES